MNSQNPKLSRRILFAGAGTAGVVAAAASLLPQVRGAVPELISSKAKPARGGGYELSEHVKRYYKTTLV